MSKDLAMTPPPDCFSPPTSRDWADLFPASPEDVASPLWSLVAPADGPLAAVGTL